MHQRNSAFTLIELVVTVALLALLAAIAYPSYQNVVNGTKSKHAIADIYELQLRIDRYVLDNDMTLPATLADIGRADPGIGAAIVEVDVVEIGEGVRRILTENAAARHGIAHRELRQAVLEILPGARPVRRRELQILTEVAGIGRSDRDTAFYDPVDDQTVSAKKKQLQSQD